MVAVSFSVFKDKIISGEKTQAIRKYTLRKYELFRKSRYIYLYWKLRTKECSLLNVGEIEDVFIIRLYEPEMYYTFNSKSTDNRFIFYWDGRRWTKVSDLEKESIIKRDGFESEEEFYRWFSRYNKDEIFIVIRWRERLDYQIHKDMVYINVGDMSITVICVGDIYILPYIEYKKDKFYLMW